ncbi:Hypothetical predicted protein [Cloeon dipterum]|uniref:Uncharacterized protein n=1 Tax=Cloeon dipterum TaxID=197152 RepID=A0A8S1E443_9INSE|nr:Hypothetical predicted protein [Cloeon dipterum]
MMFEHAYGDQTSRYTLVVYEDGGPKVAHLSVDGVFFERAAQFQKPKDPKVWQLVIVPSEELTLTCVHFALQLIHGEAISAQALEDTSIQLGIFKLALAWSSTFLADLTVDKVLAACRGPDLVDLLDTLVKYQQNLGLEHSATSRSVFFPEIQFL